MLTRGSVARNYGVNVPRPVRLPGKQRITEDGQQSYAVQRPTNSPTPNAAPPLNVTSYPALPPEQHNRRAMSGGATSLNLRAQTGQALNRRSGG
jgi:hypothetical protein